VLNQETAFVNFYVVVCLLLLTAPKYLYGMHWNDLFLSCFSSWVTYIGLASNKDL